VVWIRCGGSEEIAEHGSSLIERNVVLAEILSRFPSIPLELHASQCSPAASDFAVSQRPQPRVNAIVPYEVATSGSTTVEVEYNGTRVPAGGFVLVPAAPAIFTVDSTGQGQAKARSADSSVNSPQNPAARGSLIQFYGTGEGVTSPPGVTADASAGKKPVLSLKVTIGGADATVQEAVSLAGAMPWVLQVSASIPQNIVPGDSVPIILTIGGAHSQDRVTIAVK
jgi:uncharacterized protein (TIGR03437 family)